MLLCIGLRCHLLHKLWFFCQQIKIPCFKLLPPFFSVHFAFLARLNVCLSLEKCLFAFLSLSDRGLVTKVSLFVLVLRFWDGFDVVYDVVGRELLQWFFFGSWGCRLIWLVVWSHACIFIAKDAVEAKWWVSCIWKWCGLLYHIGLQSSLIASCYVRS